MLDGFPGDGEEQGPNTARTGRPGVTHPPPLAEVALESAQDTPDSLCLPADPQDQCWPRAQPPQEGVLGCKRRSVFPGRLPGLIPLAGARRAASRGGVGVLVYLPISRGPWGREQAPGSVQSWGGGALCEVGQLLLTATPACSSHAPLARADAETFLPGCLQHTWLIF